MQANQALQKRIEYIGSHLSIAGGHSNALKMAHRCGMNTVALFTASPRIWKRPDLGNVNTYEFQESKTHYQIAHIVGHALYLANPATDQASIRKKSISAITADLQVCHNLGIPWLVIHPGSHKGDDLATGITRIAQTLDTCLELAGTCTTGLALETTSGAGNSIGGKFEHLRDIIAESRYPDRYSVCIDTCHIFAAGYDFRCKQTWLETRSKINEIIGFDRIRCIHLNDSKGELGSNRDRHEHIGLGEIGDKGFANIVNDPYMQGIPLIFETPKDKEHRLDKMNRKKLIDLMTG